MIVTLLPNTDTDDAAREIVTLIPHTDLDDGAKTGKLWKLVKELRK